MLLMSSRREPRLRLLQLLLLLLANQLSQWAWSQPVDQKVCSRREEVQGDRLMSFMDDVIEYPPNYPPSHTHSPSTFTFTHSPLHILTHTHSPSCPHTPSPSEHTKVAPLTSSLSVFDPFKPATPTSTQQLSSSNMACKQFIVGSWQEEVSHCRMANSCCNITECSFSL